MDEYLGNSEIYERFLDAAAALVMDQYGAAVADSVSRTAAEPVEIPEALDKKCRKLIREKLSKERRVRFAKKAMRFTVAAALCVVMLFGVTGILFITVEAVRIPIINFFIAQGNGYIEIGSGSAHAGSNIFDDGQDSGTNTDIMAQLASVMPDGYFVTEYTTTKSGGFAGLFESDSSESIYFFADSATKELRVDDERAEFTTKLRILSHEALLIEKDGYQLVWFDEDTSRLYQLSASELTREEVIALAKNIEKIF